MITQSRDIPADLSDLKLAAALFEAGDQAIAMARALEKARDAAKDDAIYSALDSSSLSVWEISKFLIGKARKLEEKPC